MPELKGFCMPQQRLRVLHAIAGTQCRQINKYILKKKKTRRKKEECQVWISKIWSPILANTGSEKESTRREAVRIHCDKYQLSSTEMVSSIHQHICAKVWAHTCSCHISRFGSTSHKCDQSCKCPDESNKINKISDQEILIFIYP